MEIKSKYRQCIEADTVEILKGLANNGMKAHNFAIDYQLSGDPEQSGTAYDAIVTLLLKVNPNHDNLAK